MQKEKALNMQWIFHYYESHKAQPKCKVSGEKKLKGYVWELKN